jgi:hypothetical protein
MKEFSISKWFEITLVNFVIVAAIGVLMRYKIGFEFPYFDQKNLQHAHSHFAFAAWVSQTLMVMMIALLQSAVPASRIQKYHWLMWCNLLVAIGMLVSFAWQGYKMVSITLSTTSIIIAYYFAFLYCSDLAKAPNIKVKPWLKAALFFNILSTLGTFYLVKMMATKTLEQHAYLASVYWYLHFQYNGWFFFAGTGLFLQYLWEKLAVELPAGVFWAFALSCIPLYGLSVLWLDLPLWLYIVVVLTAILQTSGWVHLLFCLFRDGIRSRIADSTLGNFLLLFLTIAITIKFTLQLGSVHPALSELAFGFRPIVIAYLHLVLLAIISVLLLTIGYLRGFLQKNRLTALGIVILLIGIFLNEFALATQGIASFSYVMIPGINVWLFLISILLLSGIGLLAAGHIFARK